MPIRINFPISQCKAVLRSLALTAGFLPLAAGGRSPAEEQALIAAAGRIARECIEAQSHFLLGIENPSEESQGIEHLLKRGEACLSEMEPQWQMANFQRSASALVDSTASAVSAIVQARARATAQILSDSTTGEVDAIGFDPWAGIDAKCDFVPKELEIIRTPEGAHLAGVEVGNLPALIPPRYRLAEALGLGRNRFECKASWIEPIQTRRQLEGAWTIVLHARVHCELIGIFDASIDLEESSPHGGGKRNRRLETVRVAVTSRARTEAGRNRTGSDLGNPNTYQLNDRPIIETLELKHPANPWFRELLPAAAAERGSLLTPVDPESREGYASDWFVPTLEKKLGNLRKEAADLVAQDSAVIAQLEALRQSREALLAEFTAEEGSDATLSRQLLALDSLDAGSLINARQLGRIPLERLVPATRLTLDAMRRELQAASVPSVLRPHSTSLATQLNDLAAWSVRK